MVVAAIAEIGILSLPFTKTFPTERKFDELKINYRDFNDIAKNWINLQSFINLFSPY